MKISSTYFFFELGKDFLPLVAPLLVFVSVRYLVMRNDCFKIILHTFLTSSEYIMVSFMLLIQGWAVWMI